MEFLLLQMFAFLRPIFFIDAKISVFGLTLFEVAAILFFGLLTFAFLIRASVQGKLRISEIDLVMVAFVLWCLAIYIIYFSDASLRDVIKLTLPPLTYMIAKNSISTEQQYFRLLILLILGFIAPVVLSAALIAAGHGVYLINYWTGIPRYQGAYTGPHNMGHNMTFLILLMAMYLGLGRIVPGAPRANVTMKIVFAVLGLLALYCLYKSAVRTAILGLLIYGAVYLYFFNKRLFVLGAAVVAIAAIILAPVIIPVLAPDVVNVSKGKWDTDQLGSGRPQIWASNLSIYADLPVDRKLAGVGIGNKVEVVDFGNVEDSHNDFLDLLMQTGGVGLGLFAIFNFLVWRKIMHIPGRERYVFLALFVAVIVMNFVSNSYVARFGLGQMYYMIMAYIELPALESRLKVARESQLYSPSHA